MAMDIQREIAALPALRFASDEDEEPTALSPLEIVAKQGRLILRLGASAEALDQRYQELATRLDEREVRLSRAEETRRAADAASRQVALGAIHLMDALDWVHDSLLQQGNATFAGEVEAARRDCLRRLAAAGIAEVPRQGLMDGRLHEGLDSVPSTDVPRYHILRVVRRGFQSGPDVLRRAGVITAA